MTYGLEIRTYCRITDDLEGAGVEKTPEGYEKHKVELRQLGRQGVSRCLGSVALCKVFKVIACVPDDYCAGNEVLHLGLTESAYKFTGDSSMLAALLRHVDPSCIAGEVTDATSLQAYSDAVRTALVQLGGDVPAMQTKAEGHVLTWLTRKLMIAKVAYSATCIDWAMVPASSLQRSVPDQRQHVRSVPQTWSAKDLSMLLCERVDWVLFVSLFACLWSEALRLWHGEVGELLNISSSDAFAREIRKFKEEHATTPCPATVLQRIQVERKPKQQRAKRVSAASRGNGSK